MKLVYDEYCYKCEKCHGRMSLPGIVPSIDMLKRQGWKYCPYCGEKIEYSPDNSKQEQTECYGLGYEPCEHCDRQCPYR